MKRLRLTTSPVASTKSRSGSILVFLVAGVVMLLAMTMISVDIATMQLTRAELRAATDAAGVHVVLNARTDLFFRADGDESDRVDRAVARLTEAADAGADVLYPVGRHDPDTLRRLTSELPLPVNVIGLPDRDDPASFGPLGVARISFGPFLQGALTERAKEILARWG